MFHKEMYKKNIMVRKLKFEKKKIKFAINFSLYMEKVKKADGPVYEESFSKVFLQI